MKRQKEKRRITGGREIRKKGRRIWRKQKKKRTKILLKIKGEQGGRETKQEEGWGENERGKKERRANVEVKMIKRQNKINE